MGFQTVLESWSEERIREAIAGAGPHDVSRALERDPGHPEDLAALLSPEATPRLEDMARQAHRLTRRHFGRTIGLYVPLYLSAPPTAPIASMPNIPPARAPGRP